MDFCNNTLQKWQHLCQILNLMTMTRILKMSNHQFVTASQLLIEKYEENIQAVAFINYFPRNGFNSAATAVEGDAVGMPSTDNALESFNRKMKDEQTRHEQLSMRAYLKTMLQSLTRLSNERAVGREVIPFAEVPTIQQVLYSKAYGLVHDRGACPTTFWGLDPAGGSVHPTS
jgi:hypothetical protein